MAQVRIPGPLRGQSGGETEVGVDGGDLAAVLANLEAAYPGLAGRVLDDEGRLHRFVNVFVGEQDARILGGLETPVGEHDTVSIVPAVAGGAD